MTGEDVDGGMCRKKSPKCTGISGHYRHTSTPLWTPPIQTVTVGPGISPGLPIMAVLVFHATVAGSRARLFFNRKAIPPVGNLTLPRSLNNSNIS
jgi:hypothetical protein